jgi:hypothetical protein
MAARSTRGPGGHRRLASVPRPPRAGRSRGIDISPEEWLAQTDTKILICRGQKHDIPILDPDNPVDALVSVKDGGVVHLTFPCGRCGMEVSFETLEDGVLDRRYVKRKYEKYPPEYHAPKDVTPTDCLQETIRRTVQVKAAAQVS